MIRGGADSAEAEAALGLALNMGIRLVEPNFIDVLRLAAETGLTAYDASYLQVARTLSVQLVTFDDHLDAAAQVTAEQFVQPVGLSHGSLRGEAALALTRYGHSPGNPDLMAWLREQG